MNHGSSSTWYDATRCKQTGKRKAVCLCDDCMSLDEEAVRRRVTEQDAAWAARARQSRDAELAAMRGGQPSAPAAAAVFEAKTILAGAGGAEGGAERRAERRAQRSLVLSDAKLSVAPPAPPELPLAVGWEAVPTDDGRTYFWHTETDTVTWDRPVLGSAAAKMMAAAKESHVGEELSIPAEENAQMIKALRGDVALVSTRAEWAGGAVEPEGQRKSKAAAVEDARAESDIAASTSSGQASTVTEWGMAADPLIPGSVMPHRFAAEILAGKGAVVERATDKHAARDVEFMDAVAGRRAVADQVMAESYAASAAAKSLDQPECGHGPSTAATSASAAVATVPGVSTGGARSWADAELLVVTDQEVSQEIGGVQMYRGQLPGSSGNVSLASTIGGEEEAVADKGGGGFAHMREGASEARLLDAPCAAAQCSRGEVSAWASADQEAGQKSDWQDVSGGDTGQGSDDEIEALIEAAVARADREAAEAATRSASAFATTTTRGAAGASETVRSCTEVPLLGNLGVSLTTTLPESVSGSLASTLGASLPLRASRHSVSMDFELEDASPPASPDVEGELAGRAAAALSSSSTSPKPHGTVPSLLGRLACASDGPPGVVHHDPPAAQAPLPISHGAVLLGDKTAVESGGGLAQPAPMAIVRVAAAAPVRVACHPVATVRLAGASGSAAPAGAAVVAVASAPAVRVTAARATAASGSAARVTAFPTSAARMAGATVRAAAMPGAGVAALAVSAPAAASHASAPMPPRPQSSATPGATLSLATASKATITPGQATMVAPPTAAAQLFTVDTSQPVLRSAPLPSHLKQLQDNAQKAVRVIETNKGGQAVAGLPDEKGRAGIDVIEQLDPKQSAPLPLGRNAGEAGAAEQLRLMDSERSIQPSSAGEGEMFASESTSVAKVGMAVEVREESADAVDPNPLATATIAETLTMHAAAAHSLAAKLIVKVDEMDVDEPIVRPVLHKPDISLEDLEAEEETPPATPVRPQGAASAPPDIAQGAMPAAVAFPAAEDLRGTADPAQSMEEGVMARMRAGSEHPEALGKRGAVGVAPEAEDAVVERHTPAHMQPALTAAGEPRATAPGMEAPHAPSLVRCPRVASAHPLADAPSLAGRHALSSPLAPSGLPPFPGRAIVYLDALKLLLPFARVQRLHVTVQVMLNGTPICADVSQRIGMPSRLSTTVHMWDRLELILPQFNQGATPAVRLDVCGSSRYGVEGLATLCIPLQELLLAGRATWKQGASSVLDLPLATSVAGAPAVRLWVRLAAKGPDAPWSAGAPPRTSCANFAHELRFSGRAGFSSVALASGWAWG